MNGFEESLLRRWDERRKNPPQRFRELVRAIDAVARQPGAVEVFREHIRDVAACRAKAVAEKTAVEEKLHPFYDAGKSPPQELLHELRAAEAKLSPLRGAGVPLALAEKYAYLGAVHDEFAEAERFDTIRPPDWDRDFCADWQANKEAWLARLGYHASASGFEDKYQVPDDSPEIDVLHRHLDDVRADLATQERMARAVGEYLDRVVSHAATVGNELQRSKAPTYPVNGQTIEGNRKALLWLLGPAVPTGTFDPDAMAGYGVKPATLMSFFATAGQDSDILRALRWLADLAAKLKGLSSRPDAALADGWREATALLRKAADEAIKSDPRLAAARQATDDFADVEGLPAEIASILKRGDFPALSDDEYAKLRAWLTANERKHYDGLDPASIAKTRRMEEAKTRLRAVLEYNAALREAVAPGGGAGSVAHQADSKEQPWADDAPEYLPLKEASKLTDASISLPALSKLCKPAGEMRYMRKPGRGCKVHIADFRLYMRGRLSDSEWAAAYMNWLNATKAGKFRMFMRCKKCGHEYPDEPTATDRCPKCKEEAEVTLKKPPKPRPNQGTIASHAVSRAAAH